MWNIQLLGGLVVRSANRTATRFRTQKTAALLAYLAFRCRENIPPQPREHLVEMLWPEAALDAGRHNLSNALTALRHVLEPPGVPPGTILTANRASVRLNPAGVSTDVARFEELARRCWDERLPAPERVFLLRQAMEGYGGPLLPGFYEEWLQPESTRLANLFLRVLREATPLLRAAGDLDTLLAASQRAVGNDPWCEEAIELSMQALAAAGDPARALRQYRDFEHRLREEVGVQPSPGLREYASQLELSFRQKRARPAAETRSPALLARSVVDAPEPRPRSTGTLRGPAFTALTVTRFFDRQQESECLASLFQTPRTRLITVTGPGGTGKTRLALETASRLVEEGSAAAPSSATFVPLAEVAEGERIPEALLRSLGVNPQPGADLLEQAAAVLGRDPMPLLVLDNFEHLVESGSASVQALLTAAPHMRCMVTSRQKLLLEGEHEVRLEPLPAQVADVTPEALAANPSVQLFVDRAQMQRPDFQLTRHNAEAVAQLCQQLEGVPLALELAAARVSMLSPAQILEGIRRDRLDFLVSRRRDAVARHRTLRATLDWSFEILPPAAGRVLAELSVFRAGFTLEAAAAVCPEAAAGDCLELLSILQDASLVGVEHGEEGLRFTLLETVRQYAEERLTASRETERLQLRHAEYFAAWAEQQQAHFRTPSHGEALRRLARDQENLRAALEWSGRTGQPLLQARFAIALTTFWKMQGHSEAAVAWYAEVVSAALAGARVCPLAAALPRPVTIRLLLSLVTLCGNLGRAAEQEALCRWALALAAEVDDPMLRAESLALWALDPTHGGPTGTLVVLDEALGLARAAGEEQLIARILHYKAFFHQQLDEVEAARAANEEALALFRRLADPVGTADVLRNRGYSRIWHENDPHAACHDFEENLAMRRRIEDQPGVALALTALAEAAREIGDTRQAVAVLREASAAFEKCGWSNSAHHGYVLHDLGELAWEQDQSEEAWGAICRAIGIFLHSRYFAVAAKSVQFLAEQAPPTAARAAARLAGAADRLHGLGGAPGEPPENRVPALLARLTARLGSPDLHAATAAGRQLTDLELLELATSLGPRRQVSNPAP